MELNKMDGMSMNIEQTEMEKLKSVFPQCFAEGKLDIDKLLSLCGEYIDNDFEKYKFEWKGKIEALKLAQKRSTGTLRPCKAESVNFDETKNLYIEGDNLEVLKLLQTAYYNKIKMIYIDPPYNTGNDFVYEDDFADPMARYKEVTQQATKSNAETMGRYHTNWLNMMYPRLRLAHNLLTEDGAIFISIDDNEITNLRKLCDEIFGEENFVIQISWRRTDNQPNVGKVARVKEYILCYAKNNSMLQLGKLPLTDKAKGEYRYEDENGLFRRAILLDKTRGRHYYPVTTKSGNILNGPWMKTEEEFRRLDEQGAIYWTSGGDEQPYGKIYLKDSQGAIPNDFWGIEYGTNQRASLEVEKLFGKRYFDFPKPVSLIKMLIRLGANNDSIVMDFFSGSSTTAQAIMEMNVEDSGKRKFIMVQIPEILEEKSLAFKDGYENICEIGKERIRLAGKKILEETTTETVDVAQYGEGYEVDAVASKYKNLDIGFKVFKLDDSNLKTWDNTPIQDTQIDLFYERLNAMIDTVKDDRTDMDVVYEVMLKMGIPLDVEVQYMEINDKIAYIVGDFILMICLADKITAEDIEAMAQYAPAKIICAEAGFADDSALSNAHYILKDRAIELKLV